MNKIIYLLIIFFIGCGSEYEPKVEWSGKIDEKSNLFTLSYDTKRFPGPHLLRIEQWWIDIQTCAGISIDISDKPLIIEYTGYEGMPEGSGRIEYKQRYARVIDTDLFNASNHNGRITRHELTHWLIYLVDGNTKSNTDHTHPFFKLCKT